MFIDLHHWMLFSSALFVVIRREINHLPLIRLKCDDENNNSYDGIIRHNEMNLSSSQKQQLKIMIKEQMSDLESRLVMTAESSKTVELDQALAGRISRIDAIQQQKIAQAGLNRAKANLIKLTRTLQQIDSEGFGYCQECGEAIGMARLQIKPESSFCVECQQEKE